MCCAFRALKKLSAKHFFQGLHPFTRLALGLGLSAAGFVLPPVFCALWLPVGLGLAAAAGILRPTLRALAVFLTPLAVSLLVVRGFFWPANLTPLLHLGPFTLGLEGSLLALGVLARLANALTGSLVFVLTTPPADLTRAMHAAGAPVQLTFVIASAMQWLPEMRRRTTDIWAAQSARGLVTGGRLPTRLRALLPLAIPLVLAALVDVEERAVALESRAFSASGAKTSLKQLPDSAVQRWLRRAVPAGLIGLGLLRVIL